MELWRGAACAAASSISRVALHLDIHRYFDQVFVYLELLGFPTYVREAIGRKRTDTSAPRPTPPRSRAAQVQPPVRQGRGQLHVRPSSAGEPAGRRARLPLSGGVGRWPAFRKTRALSRTASSAGSCGLSAGASVSALPTCRAPAASASPHWSAWNRDGAGARPSISGGSHRRWTPRSRTCAARAW